jgi:hypothetical protein
VVGTVLTMIALERSPSHMVVYTEVDGAIAKVVIKK